MIEIFRANIIKNKKEYTDAMKVIAERESYYVKLFAQESCPPRIKITYEGASPLTVRILFSPVNGKTIVVQENSYGTADAVTKHAFKKLRRRAKNHFIKVKKQHRK